MSKQAKSIIWIVWFLIVPAGYYFSFKYYAPSEVDWTLLLAFLAMALLTVIFPFKVLGTTIFLIQWINLAMFLTYGLFVDIVITQIAIIPLMLRMKYQLVDFHRILFNSFMFFTISFVSGSFVLFLGYEVGTSKLSEILIYGSIYTITLVVVNHVLIHFYISLEDKNRKFFAKDIFWDYTGLIVTLPFGITLYLLQLYVGNLSFLLLGIPFLMITLLLRMYNNSELVNDDLNRASKIGHELADRLSGSAIVDLFLKNLSDMLPLDYVYIIDIKDDEFYVLRAIENGQDMKLLTEHEILAIGIPGIVYKKDKSLFFSKKSEWKEIKTDFLPKNTESIIAVPISRNQKIEGILVIGSRKKHAFELHQLQILNLLCSYFAVSLEKARYVEETVSKSEQCGLTQLYNYRYFDQELEKKMNELLNGNLRQLSLLMMDIDHFKNINDTYGHQSGNDILYGLARLLEKEIGEIGTIARYGGEEFVLLLPNYSKQQSLELAEKLREIIETTPFELRTDLAEQRQLTEVQITASIGVSTAPEDCDEAMALIRNADRALYIGAKRAGRNRVAEYVK
ncbi:MAG: sensor domain-containing diguanylate cyclase [Paenisporosarcina sp.]